MERNKRPKNISLTAEQASALKERLANSSLSEADKELVSGLMSFNLWLEQQLQQAKLGIRRLKSIFGIKTEKKSSENL